MSDSLLNKYNFILNEVEKLVHKAYDAGFCDGINSTNVFDNSDFKEYKNSRDYWESNVDKWRNFTIEYIK